MTIHTLRTLLLASLLLGTCGAQNPSHPFATFDVRFLLAPGVSVPFDAELPLWGLYPDAGSDVRRGRRTEGRLSLDSVADLVRANVAPETWDNEGCQIRPASGSIVCRNEQSVLAEIRAFVDYLHRAVGRSISVDVWRLPASGAPAAGVVTAEVATGLIAHPSATVAGKLELGSNRPGRLRAGHLITFLGDYDVEVAEEAQVADPRMFVLRDGLDLQLGVWNTPDGRVILRVSGRDSSLEKLVKRDTASTWVGQLQLPVVDSQVVSGSGVVESGGGIVLGAAQGDGDTVFFVRVRSEAIPDLGPGGGCAFIPAGAAAVSFQQMGPLRVGVPSRSGFDPSGIDGVDVPEEDRILEVDSLIEMVRGHVDPDGWDEDPSWALWTAGDNLFVRAPKEVIAGARALATALNDTHLTNVGLEFRIGVLDAERTRAVSTGQADLAAVAGLLDTKAWVATLAGAGFRQLLGRETAYLKDHDVEIAQKATIADPVVATLFAGVAFQGRAVSAGLGKVGLTGEFLIQDVVGEVAPIDGNANDIGVVDIPRTSTTRANVAQILEDGRWAVLRLASRPEGEGSLAILVRARL